MKRERQRVTVPINGKRVKYLIKLAGTTQIKLADQIGYTKDRLNQILRTGKALPRIIETLGSVLNADPGYITGDYTFNLDAMPAADRNAWQNLIDSGSVRLDPERNIILPYSFYSDKIQIDRYHAAAVQLVKEFVNSPRIFTEENRIILNNMPEKYMNRITEKITAVLDSEIDSILWELRTEKDNK